ncbi:MAG: sulfurtransferase complex subunit TusD [Gammaproteobacteria bacterium]|nr:sulfurtransferase complex subunit TusD [Gammaproteobacteria bacterium]MDP2141181.1 sulfurtransferase complex subunit TusD [Gammaproteobacteria bacterium]MDP2349145.1 sulfurtransferase complex subunit TusD [Gammaproteobacteria bacterium]
MKLTVVVYSAPYSSQAAWSAYQFTRAALTAGHEIYRLFFYADGVHNSNALSIPPQDEFDLVKAWQALISGHNIDAISCVSSALKRGVVDAQEAARYERACSNLVEGVSLSGLGQLVDATLVSDRVVSFGA